MQNQKVMVAPVGEGIKSLWVALKEVPVRKVHLIVDSDNRSRADLTKKQLEEMQVAVRLWPIHGDLWEETFRVVSEIVQAESDIVVHVGTADRNLQCAATSAAFVNGVYAINGDDKTIGALPVLKFNYYSYLTEKKLAILQALNEKPYKSLDELSRTVKMSLPLLSYHIHGNYKTEGLVQMNLVELQERGATQAITLTPMARLLLKGHVGQTTPKDAKERKYKHTARKEQ